MRATPFLSDSSTDADTVPPAPARKSPFPIRTLLLGLGGMILIVLGGVGAGATLTHDPLLTRSDLNWFRYGHGQMLAVWLVYIGLGLLIWAWVRLGRHVRAGRVGTPELIRIAIVWVLPLLISPPLFSKDVYSYLAQGDLALHGWNPYAVGPAARPSLISDNVSWIWQNTPAPYGPLFILIAEGIVALVGSNLIFSVIAMRLAMTVGLVLLCWALPKLCRQLGGKTSIAMWLVAVNPLILVHLIGGAHNDMLMVGLMAAGAALALDRKHVLGIVLITLAVAVKATAVVLLPFLVWIWAARLTGSFRKRFFTAAGSTTAIFVVVFAACSLVARVDLGWIFALKSSSVVANWLSLPTAAGQIVFGLAYVIFDSKDMWPYVDVARVVGSVALVIFIALQWWRARAGGLDVMRQVTLVLAVTVLLAPTAMPWYFSWALAFAAALPWSNLGTILLTCGSVWMLLITYPDGSSALYDWGYLAVATAIAALAGISLIKPDPLKLALRTVKDVAEKPLKRTTKPSTTKPEPAPYA